MITKNYKLRLKTTHPGKGSSFLLLAFFALYAFHLNWSCGNWGERKMYGVGACGASEAKSEKAILRSLHKFSRAHWLIFIVNKQTDT